VRECFIHEFNHVAVGKRVCTVFAVARANHNVFASKNTKPLRNGGHCFALDCCKLSDAAFALSKSRSQTQPRRVSKCPEEPRRLIHCRFVYKQRCKRRVSIRLAAFIVFRIERNCFHNSSIAHFIKCASV
jgi:hypothetical protein